MKIIAEGECWSQKWFQDRGDTESVSEQQFCCDTVLAVLFYYVRHSRVIVLLLQLQSSNRGGHGELIVDITTQLSSEVNTQYSLK